MDIKIAKKTEEKKFEPVEIILTVTTIEELRLLFHVFNRRDLLEALKKGGKNNGYNFDYYSSDIADQFGGDDDCISNEILKQGYKV